MYLKGETKMVPDSTNLTQSMLRAWQETNFPGLPVAERIRRAVIKWEAESIELSTAISEYQVFPTLPNFEALQDEAADVLITLMILAEFYGFNLTEAAIKKYNILQNRVWAQSGTDANGFPIWERVRDTRSQKQREEIDNAV